MIFQNAEYIKKPSLKAMHFRISEKGKVTRRFARPTFGLTVVSFSWNLARSLRGSIGGNYDVSPHSSREVTRHLADVVIVTRLSRCESY